MTPIPTPRRFAGIVILAVIVAALTAWWARRDVDEAPYVAVLGIAQDGGRPHIGCEESCCTSAARDGRRDLVSCLALVDPVRGRRWIFDATPDLPAQLRLLDTIDDRQSRLDRKEVGLAGIFLTHAHIGHYTGLMYLGREAMGASAFLRGSGPWSQLVDLQNIEIESLQADRSVDLGGGITVTPWIVPHRDEYSETVGFLIATRQGKALYLPDIDKWERWSRDLAVVVEELDHAFIDATFFSAAELPGRNLEEIPHPTVQETMNLLESLPESQRRKVKFIHLNHSNPALDREGDAHRSIRAMSMDVAEAGAVYRFD
jgi:pyrroloquinoline quinone biosynthesis protein B